MPAPTMNLATLDVNRDRISCAVERFEPFGQFSNTPILLRWSAIACPAGYEPVGGGVAFVKGPKPLQFERYPAMLVDLGENRYGWFDRTSGNRVLIVVLPEGTTASALQPDAWSAKVHNGRVAVLWTADELDASRDVVWTLTDSTLGAKADCIAINSRRATSTRRTQVEPLRLSTAW